MANYIIKRKSVKLKIKKIKRIDGYKLNPNIKNVKMVSIESLSIENEKCIDILITKKIDKSFRKITALYLSIMDDNDATSGDITIALNEIERLKNIIAYKYKEYLNEELVLKYLKRISLFEKNLQDKLNVLRLTEEMMWNKTKGR